MALKFPDRLESNNPSAYGIVKAIEVAGHKTVSSLSALCSVPDCILSVSGNNTDNDAIGQLWYVVDEGKIYQLSDWDNRNSQEGWGEYLGDYATVEDIEETLEGKQDKLTAGTGIDITEDNVISCTLDTDVFIFVDELPLLVNALENKIYLVPKQENIGTYQEYVEYIVRNITDSAGYASRTWEKIGEYDLNLELGDYLKIEDAETTYLKKENIVNSLDGGTEEQVLGAQMGAELKSQIDQISEETIHSVTATEGKGIIVEGTEKDPTIGILRDPDSEDFLSLSDSGLKLSGVQDAIDLGDDTVREEYKADLSEMQSHTEYTYNINTLFPSQGSGDNNENWTLTQALARLNTILSTEDIVSGIKVKFLDTNGDWITYTFYGGSLLDENNWVYDLTSQDFEDLADLIPVATQDSNGMMSAEDKKKFDELKDGIEDGKSILDEIEEAVQEAKDTIDAYTVNGYKISENPVLDKADVGLDQVDNTSDIDKPVSTAQQEAIDQAKETVDNYTVNGYKISENPVLNKTDVGLDQVDNTSDLDKPISTATQEKFDELESHTEVLYNINNLLPGAGGGTDGEQWSLLSAIVRLDTLISSEEKVPGIKIKFINEEGNWRTYTYYGDSISDTSCWEYDLTSKDFVELATENLPTATQEANGTMSKEDKIILDTLAEGMEEGVSIIDKIDEKVQEAKDTIDAYTINGYEISSNPVLNNTDIGLSEVTNDAQVKRSEMGVADGVATLDSNGKVPTSQLPDSVLGNVKYMGVWDASTNDPYLEDGNSEDSGHYYIVSIAGTQFGYDFDPGDWIINSEGAWSKVDNVDAVKSVNGQIGVVELEISDIPSLTDELDSKALQTDFQAHLDDKNNPHEVTKEQIGLDQVDNTSDLDKPVSTATQEKFDDLESHTEVLYNVTDLFPGEGVSGDNNEQWNLSHAVSRLSSYLSDTEKVSGIKIKYIDTDGNWITYTYNGGDFIESSSWIYDLTQNDLDTLVNYIPDATQTSSGLMSSEDKKKLDDLSDGIEDSKSIVDTIEEKVQETKEIIDEYTVNGHKISENPVLDKTDIGLDQVDNTSDLDKPISTATQEALDTIENQTEVVYNVTDLFPGEGSGSEGNQWTIQLAVSKLDGYSGTENHKVPGTKCKFINENGKWRTYTYYGTTFADPGCWEYDLTSMDFEELATEDLPVATQTSNGVMSASDKRKLDTLSEGISGDQSITEMITDAVDSAKEELQSNIDSVQTELQGNIDAAKEELQNEISSVNDDLQKSIDAINESLQSSSDSTNTTLENHITDYNNPHQVTKEQVGLGNVDNTSDLDKPVSTATQSAIDSLSENLNRTINSHVADYNNPHQVTKEQVGLGNVDNTEDVNKPISIAQQAALDSLNQTLSSSINSVTTMAENHISDLNNPHQVTKYQINLDQVDNTSDINKPVSTAQQAAIDNAKLELQSAIDLNKSTIDSYTVNGYKISENPVLTKEDIGLGNVDNTADLDKPVSYHVQYALDSLEASLTSNLNAHLADYDNPHQVTKEQVGLTNVTDDAQVKRTEMGVAGGVATLDESGLIPSSQLPSYVDSIVEADSFDTLPETGETGKIYVTKDTNITYRWSGSQYIEISASLALGETSSTAYPGDKGKETTDKVNDHLSDYNNPHQVTKEQLGLENVNNTADLDKPISTATQTAIDNLKAELESSISSGNSELSDLISNHVSNVSNPHQVTKEQLGLGNVDNTADLDKPVSTATQTAIDNAKSELSTSLDIHIADKNNPHSVTKEQVGLGNVNNTADLDKPVSTAQQAAIDSVSSALTLALQTHTLNTSNPHQVTKDQIGLSNVDNTSDLSKPVSVAQQAAIDEVRNTLSTQVTETSNSLTIHLADLNNPHQVTKEQLGLGNVDNTSDLNKPISTATQTALDNKADLVSGVVPDEQLPIRTLHSLYYKGLWDADINSPTLENNNNAEQDGDYYIVRQSGTRFGFEFLPNDIVYNAGGAWYRIMGSEQRDESTKFYIISFEADNYVFEVGETATVNFTWEYNGLDAGEAVDLQVINQYTIESGLRSYSISGITEDTDFVLNAASGSLSDSATVSVKFYYKFYLGTSSNSSVTDSDLLGMSSYYVDGTTEAPLTELDCDGGKYIYVAIPADSCDNYKIFANGILVNDTEDTTRTVTNASGGTTSYKISRFANKYYGVLNVEVKLLS